MTGREKLSDAELSKKLGHYQKMSRVWILVGLFGALSGTVSYFAVQDTALKAILTGVLFFGGVCCAVFSPLAVFTLTSPTVKLSMFQLAALCCVKYPAAALHAAAQINTSRQSSGVTPAFSRACHCAAEIRQSLCKSSSSAPEGAACAAAS